MDREDVLWITSFGILVIWAFSAIAGIVTKDYQALQLVTPIMLALAGYLFGVEITKGRNGRKNGTDAPNREEA